MKFKCSILTGLLVFLGGCAGGPKIEDYADRKPAIDIRHYLNGNVEAWGVLLDRSGVVTEQFHVVMKGTWKGNDGTLEEKFTFSSGKKDERVWTVHFTDDHHFTASAHDVIGTATGKQYGNAVNMNYILRVPVDGTTYDLSMDDWMYLMTDDTLINRTEMRKFGFKVGELVLTFKKKS